MDNGIDGTLAERGKCYGSFNGQARIAQEIKTAMRLSPNWTRLSPCMMEALEMIAHKIGRILNGNINHKDSWHDIVGYAKLIDDTLSDIPSDSGNYITPVR
jgi:hypothetical protein